MKNIDFLPSRYAERRVRRKSRIWRLFVVALFGAVVGAAAVSQQAFYLAAKRQFEEVETQFTLAESRGAQLSSVQRQLQKAKSEALLQVYLRHPWPWTRVMESLVAPLPDAVEITELATAQEPIPAEPTATAAPPRRGSARDDPRRLLPAERDLARLRQQRDGHRTTLRLSGVAHEITALHEYVERLGQTPLLAKAEIVSMERMPAGGSDGAVRFRLRLELASGYGQPEGPGPVPEQRKPTVASHRSRLESRDAATAEESLQ